MSEIQNAVNFLRCCIEYAADEELTPITSDEDAAVQVEGYRESFGDELPELLNDPYWMKVCWYRAIKAEKARRLENQENKNPEIILGNPELSYEISECGAPLETVIEIVERENPGWKFDRTEARYQSCIMAIFVKEA